ncbi:MAG: hypothetical protein KJO32_13040 [Deltaproteobacteria bacterium]|nr:hypothetical protein [Deltaproteobacteria bacterium]
MKSEITLAVLHEIAGRVRLRLSSPPRDENRFITALSAHEGFQEVSFNHVSKSLLITFEGGHLTTQEILLRAAIALSVEYDFQPVQVKVGKDTEVMTDGAILAGLFLLSAGAVNLSGNMNTIWLNRAAGAGVAAAVIEHGWREAREKGYIHPEVLSFGYLLASLARGTILRGAAVTWVASFGRHLLEGPEKCIEVRPIKQGSSAGQERAYQVALVPHAVQRSPLFRLAQGLLSAIGFSGIAGNVDTLFQELKTVAQAHDKVIEGFDLQTDGISLTFR